MTDIATTRVSIDERDNGTKTASVDQRIDDLEAGHFAILRNLKDNTALTKEALDATRDVQNILVTLKTLAIVAKWVSGIAIAVTSVWGVVLLALSSGGGGITPK